MAIKRLFQLVVQQEAFPGVYETGLVTGANATILAADLEATYDVGRVERNLSRLALTPVTALVGIKTGRLTFTVEVAGHTAGSSTQAPVWAPLLRACGYTQDPVDALHAFGTGVGYLWATEGVTQGTPPQTGARVMYDVRTDATNQDTVAYLTTGSGSYTADTVGDASGAGNGWTTATEAADMAVGFLPTSIPTSTATVGSLGGAGHAVDMVYVGNTSGCVIQDVTAVATAATLQEFRILDGTPDLTATDETFTHVTVGTRTIVIDNTPANTWAQKDFPSVSIGVLEDGVQRTLAGARGNVTITWKLGEPVKMEFEFLGVPQNPVDGILTGMPGATTLTPPVFLGAAMGVQNYNAKRQFAQDFTPCINSMTLAINNNLAFQQCASAATGITGAAFATSRTITGTLDPLNVPEASFPWIADFLSGDSINMKVGWDGAADAFNSFAWQLPAMTITGESGGDREGMATRELTYSCSGRTPNNTEVVNREPSFGVHKDPDPFTVVPT